MIVYIPLANQTRDSPTPDGSLAKTFWRTTDIRPDPAADRLGTALGNRVSTGSTTYYRVRSAGNSRRDHFRNDNNRRRYRWP